MAKVFVLETGIVSFAFYGNGSFTYFCIILVGYGIVTVLS